MQLRLMLRLEGIEWQWERDPLRKIRPRGHIETSMLNGICVAGHEPRRLSHQTGDLVRHRKSGEYRFESYLGKRTGLEPLGEKCSKTGGQIVAKMDSNRLKW